MTVFIAGAGMAGLLAGNMLRTRQPSILERQPSLPNNHHAVLRFRTDAVSRELGIPFRKVRVFKSCDEADPVKAGVRYSRKVLGRYEMRSALKLEPADRYIAPADLIEQMARQQLIRFNVDAFGEANRANRPLISTAPLATLAKALDYPGPLPEFESISGWSITGEIANCDLFVTRYVTKHTEHYYRISITGNRLIIEGTGEAPINTEHFVSNAAMDLAIAYGDPIRNAVCYPSRYAKLRQLSPEGRRQAEDFIHWATLTHNIYSLGRFATWRPGLLLDDLVQDIRKIERWIDSPCYAIQKDR